MPIPVIHLLRKGQLNRHTLCFFVGRESAAKGSVVVHIDD
jgi:hypothetical protein